MVAIDRTLSILASLVTAIFVYELTPYLPFSLAAPPLSIECTKIGRGCSTGCKKSGGQCVPVSAASADTAKADILMRKRSIESCLAAADIYEAAASVPALGVAASAALKMQAADAINCAMRIRTNGNILILEGTQDTAEFKKYWGMHGPRAYALVKAARAAGAQKDAASTAIEMDAFMYSSSSKGILRQAVTGAGVTYKAIADELVHKYLAQDEGVGHCYVGGFFTVAPWPLGDKARGLKEMNAAFAYAPRSRRNGYYACLLRYMHDDYAGAAKACEAALSGRCDGPTTPDYCPFLTSQTKRLLQLSKKKL